MNELVPLVLVFDPHREPKPDHPDRAYLFESAERCFFELPDADRVERWHRRKREENQKRGRR